MKQRQYRLYLIVLAVCLHVLLSGCTQQSAVKATDIYGALEPSKEFPETTREVATETGQTHYVRRDLDDRFSAAMFDRYLADLDFSRTSFTAKDIREFERYRLEMDDVMRSGELEPAFAMYNRYQKRFAEQLQYTIDMLENRLSSIRFDADESLETERKDAPWPADSAELKDLWRRRLKSSLLNLKLAGKTTEEARDVLLKRYRNQLNQLKQIKPDDVLHVFMNSYTRCYDPHTEYLSPRVSENFNISMSLSLEGIGAVLQNENEFTKVVSLVPGGPADKAGQLKPADRIIGVAQGADGEMVNVIGWRIDDVVQLIRGPKETVVRLEIIPATAADEHQSKVLTIVRDTVRLEEQAAKKKTVTVAKGGASYKIGVIDIPAFYHDFRGEKARSDAVRSTATDVRRLLGELGKEKVRGVVIDLRDNGGGSLQEANAVTGLFIEKGPIVQVKDFRGKVNVMPDPSPDMAYSGPILVLVNRTSASASEIFAAAIQDYHRGIIMGEQTFGKGTVQALVTLDRGQLKVTQAKFYRITGESTQNKGVTPDITCPSMYDKNKIGESTLPGALPWDTIEPVGYSAWPVLDQALVKLSLGHQQRTPKNPDYAFLKETAEHIRQLGDKTMVSLSEEVRRREDAQEKQWRLETENKRRAAKNLPLLDKITDNETLAPGHKDGKDNDTDSGGIDKDPILTEAANVLVDYLPLTAKGK